MRDTANIVDLYRKAECQFLFISMEVPCNFLFICFSKITTYKYFLFLFFQFVVEMSFNGMENLLFLVMKLY